MNTQRGYIWLLVFAVSAFVLAWSLSAVQIVEAQSRYIPTEDSRLWIEGTSTVRDFSCAAQELLGEAWLATAADDMEEVEVDPADVEEEEANRAHLEVRVPVDSLVCGRDRETRDLFRTMRGERFPEIVFELRDALVTRAPDGREVDHALHVTGKLSIAGVSRIVELVAWADRLEDGRVFATGTKKLAMTDFEMDPPSAMLGVIRAADEIEVHFEIYARPDG